MTEVCRIPITLTILPRNGKLPVSCLQRALKISVERHQKVFQNIAV